MPRPLLLVGLLVVGCARPESAPPAAAPTSTSAPVAVTVTTPKRVTLNWTIEQPASVQAFESTPVVAKLPGYVTKVLVDIGDTVTAGQLLAEIGIPELAKEADQKRALVDVAAAEFTQAERSLDVAKAQVAAARAGVTEAKAGQARAQADYERWESETKRVDDLVTRRVVEAQTGDETRKQFRSAASAREEVAAKVATADQMVFETVAKVGRAEADVIAAAAKKKLAAADAERVAALLDYTRVRAPFAGVVTARMIHTGHFLQPTAGARVEPLFVVARMDVVRVFVDVPETAAHKAGTGAKVTVRVPALNGREFAGAVTRTSGVISPESRTLRAEIDLPNPKGEIKPGMYAVARIAATSANTTVVPAAAVLFADETAYLYAVRDGKAVKLRAAVGRQDGGQIEIAGAKRVQGPPADFAPLADDERIVVGNLGALADGQPVTEGK